VRDVGKKCRFLLVVFLALQFASCIFVEAYAQGEANDAEETINGAENMLISAFKSVIEAEKSGVNVTLLSVQLTNAGEYLTSALLLYKAQNFSLAESDAATCFEIAQSVEFEANELLGPPAVSERFVGFSVRVLGYVVSVSIIVCGSIISWRFFKKRYFQKVMKMRPEVAS